jgi:hypothetical protein
LRVLQSVLDKTFFPSTELRNKLAKELGMSPRAVQIWFQNKRQGWRTRCRTEGFGDGVDVSSGGVGEGEDMMMMMMMMGSGSGSGSGEEGFGELQGHGGEGEGRMGGKYQRRDEEDGGEESGEFEEEEEVVGGEGMVGVSRSDSSSSGSFVVDGVLIEDEDARTAAEALLGVRRGSMAAHSNGMGGGGRFAMEVDA